MSADSAPVLVVGATGKQGGAATRALLAAGIPVRALVRDPRSDRASSVASLGADLVHGDLRDPDSLAAAVRGVRAVFSVQMAEVIDGAFDFDGELRQAVNLIDAARAAGVPQFVHTSVSGSGRLLTAPGYASGRWKPLEPYYAAKSGIEHRVREAGFPFWTLVKPGFFMENFLLSAAYLLPRGAEGGIATVLKPSTRLSLVAVGDIGATVASAVAQPQCFHAVELELASDYLPMTEIAEILSRALGVPLTAPDMTEQEALAAGMPPYAALSMELMNVAGQPARPEFAHALGIRLSSFEEWAREHMV
ncbi:NmrA family NAD(P)-binding protein [Dactylosporangium sp. AC04546]|uniref:NmrA family NAD(P)-binding protein n=1 Tax=Dactylosporangium sp. AC04546 TaxID=2862460 RepID=UPI001EDCFA17|nr:NmrA family NAD(P)-binding protein [Dactylosporangium sp. AC04546]WVK87298.1 NmrA family NAD(P)-binding protein [Dactylosporangium sp. AC04546]